MALWDPKFFFCLNPLMLKLYGGSGGDDDNVIATGRTLRALRNQEDSGANIHPKRQIDRSSL